MGVTVATALDINLKTDQHPLTINNDIRQKNTFLAQDPHVTQHKGPHKHSGSRNQTQQVWSSEMIPMALRPLRVAPQVLAL